MLISTASASVHRALRVTIAIPIAASCARSVDHMRAPSACLVKRSADAPLDQRATTTLHSVCYTASLWIDHPHACIFAGDAPGPAPILADGTNINDGKGCIPACAQGEWHMMIVTPVDGDSLPACAGCPVDTFCPSYMTFGCAGMSADGASRACTACHANAEAKTIGSTGQCVNLRRIRPDSYRWMM